MKTRGKHRVGTLFDLKSNDALFYSKIATMESNIYFLSNAYSLQS